MRFSGTENQSNPDFTLMSENNESIICRYFSKIKICESVILTSVNIFQVERPMKDNFICIYTY